MDEQHQRQAGQRTAPAPGSGSIARATEEVATARWRRTSFSPISGRSASSALVADVDELGVALCHEIGCDAGAYSAVTTVLADTPDSDS
jgi:hypothetical protein